MVERAGDAMRPFDDYPVEQHGNPEKMPDT
jgi:hypothetical protein